MTKADETKPTIPAVLSQSIGFLLNRNAIIIRDKVTTSLKPLGLSAREVGLMRILESEGPLTQHELGKRHNVDRSTTVQLVDALETRELVIRCTNPDDRRSNLLYLTPRGKKTLVKAVKLAEKEQAEFLTPLSDSDQETLRAVLFKLLNHHYTEPNS